MQDTQDLIQAQTERTERARSAILAGRLLVTRMGSQQWTVRNGDKLPYAVSLNDSQSDSIGNGWTCTCLDFQQRGPQLLCKHIEGVRLLETAQIQNLQIKEKENYMNDSIPVNKNDLQGNDIPQRDNVPEEEGVLWKLRQPLDMSRVKRRQAPGKGTVPYLEGHDIIDRANQIFDFGWSFELIREPVIVRWQKKVLIWNQQEKRKIPSLDANGNVQTEEVGIVYITGKVTVELDGKIYSHSDLGRCIFTGDTPEALDMALAGSATDCLKRCFRQMGDQFGNLLYDKEITQNAGLEKTKPNNMTSSRNTLPSTSKVERTYVDGVRVNGNIPEQEAFDQFKEKNGKTPASRNELRTWLAAQHTQAEPATVAA